jgi:drug/metabolite transporter (DMT)-like permease
MGVWGALINIPAQNGFPPTLGYSIWALTMIPTALVALKINNWHLEYDWRSILLGCTAGFLGAIGQLVLFMVLRIAPAYLVFPLLSLTPVVTILMAVLFLNEKTSKLGWIGVILSLIAIFLLSYQSPGSKTVSGYLWVLLTLIPLFMWGAQGFVQRFANETMKAESIYFYMMLTSILLIPVAVYMTDFSQSINWGFNGAWLAAGVQILNAIGALMLVYAFRFGKAIIIAPMTTALSPVLTAILSLIIYAVFPNTIALIGMIAAVVAALLISLAEETENIAEGSENTTTKTKNLKEV